MRGKAATEAVGLRKAVAQARPRNTDLFRLDGGANGQQPFAGVGQGHELLGQFVAQARPNPAHFAQLGSQGGHVDDLGAGFPERNGLEVARFEQVQDSPLPGGRKRSRPCFIGYMLDEELL